MRVAINARLVPSSGSGGVESAVLALVHALGELEGAEKYVVIAHPEAPDWLRPYIGPNQRIVVGPVPPDRQGALKRAKRFLGPLRPLVRAVWRALVRPETVPLWPWLDESGGFLEALGCNVAHMPYQCFTRSTLPTVYNPHDLQHVHFPQFFTPAIVERRERVYRTACELSHTIVAGSTWVKHDLERQYAVPAVKVQVIPWAAPTSAFGTPTSSQLEAVRNQYELPATFAYYPAMIWEHKNHLRLLEALALLRDREKLRVELVCTGLPYPPFWPSVEHQLHRLSLASQVRFLGMVPPTELRALYRLAQFVVVPTLFEAASGPVFEAWQEGAPVACSAVTSLPEQVADAALLFDPTAVDSIADAIRRMATDASLRADLVGRGTTRLGYFSWDLTARAYRAVYRKAAGLTLAEEERKLLGFNWSRPR